MKDWRIQTTFSSILFISFMFLLLLDYTFFNIISIPYPLSLLWSSYNKTLPVVISLILFFVVIYNCPAMFSTGNFVSRYLIVFIATFTLIIINSSVLYGNNESIIRIVLTTDHYFYIFLAIPLLWYVIAQGSYTKLLEGINIINFIWYILVIVQQLLFVSSGRIIFTFSNMIRGGALRVPLLSFGNLMIIYNFDCFWNKRDNHRWFHLIQFLLGWYCVIFAQQTRAYLIVLAVGIGMDMIASSVSVKKTAIAVGLGTLVLCILIYSGFLEKFLASVLTFDSGTTGLRVRAISYYIKEFMKNPVWGHGIIVNSILSPIAAGSEGIFFYTDVGIFASLAQYGIFTFVIYVWPCIHFLRVVFLIFTNEKYRLEYSFLVGMMGFILASTVTLIITDVERIFLFPFCFALFEYAEMVMKNKIIVVD